MKLVIGDYYYNIHCENFKESRTGQIRVRPLPDQGLPTTLVIECSRYWRMHYPIGTKCRTESVRICQKPTGAIYLRAKDQMIYKID